MHWSTDVYHASEFRYSNVHILPKTSHLWILSGKSYRSGSVSFSIRKDQDQMNIHYLSTGERDFCNLLASKKKVRHKLFRFNPSDKKERRIYGWIVMK